MSRGQILSLRMEQKDILAEVNQSQSECYLLLQFFALLDDSQANHSFSALQHHFITIIKN